MRGFGLVLRALAKARFWLLGLATIKDIPSERFNAIIEELRADGWRLTAQYEGVDAWIDYGSLKMRKGGRRLKFEWDNWTEGSIEGRRTLIEELSRRFQLPVSRAWRWSEYDDKA